MADGNDPSLGQRGDRLRRRRAQAENPVKTLGEMMQGFEADQPTVGRGVSAAGSAVEGLAGMAGAPFKLKGMMDAAIQRRMATAAENLAGEIATARAALEKARANDEPPGVIDRLTREVTSRQARLSAMTMAFQPGSKATGTGTGSFGMGRALQEGIVDTFGGADSAYQGELGQDVARGAGQVVGSLGLGALMGPAGFAPIVSEVPVSQYEEALQFGATEQDAARAAALSLPLAATEALPLSRVLGRFMPSPGGVGRIATEGVKGAAEEGIQEGVQTTGQNAIAIDIYDPEREATEGLGRAITVGGIVGGGASTGAAAIGSALGAGEVPPPPAPRPEPEASAPAAAPAPEPARQMPVTEVTEAPPPPAPRPEPEASAPAPEPAPQPQGAQEPLERVPAEEPDPDTGEMVETGEFAVYDPNTGRSALEGTEAAKQIEAEHAARAQPDPASAQPEAPISQPEPTQPQPEPAPEPAATDQPQPEPAPPTVPPPPAVATPEPTPAPQAPIAEPQAAPTTPPVVGTRLSLDEMSAMLDPDQRIQPDMFGGPDQTETQMAGRDRLEGMRRDWRAGYDRFIDKNMTEGDARNDSAHAIWADASQTDRALILQAAGLTSTTDQQRVGIFYLLREPWFEMPDHHKRRIIQALSGDRRAPLPMKDSDDEGPVAAEGRPATDDVRDQAAPTRSSHRSGGRRGARDRRPARGQQPATEGGARPAEGAADSAGPSRQVVGRNRDGYEIEEDGQGVRSYSRNGVRRTEPVKIKPTKKGLVTEPVNRSGTEWETSDEAAARDAAKPKPEPRGSDLFQPGKVTTSTNVEAWQEAFAKEVFAKIKGQNIALHIATPEDIQSNPKAYPKAVVSNAKRIAGGNDTLGYLHLLSEPGAPTRAVLQIKSTGAKSRRLEIMAHELGHLIELTALRNADQKTQQAIRSAFRRRTKGAPARQEMTERSPARRQRQEMRRIDADAKRYGVKPDDLVSNGARDTFHEWFADQVARHLAYSDAAVGVVEKFFRRIANMWKNLAAIYRKHSPAVKPVTQFLNDMGLTATGEIAQAMDAQFPLSSERQSVGEGDGEVGAPSSDLPEASSPKGQDKKEGAGSAGALRWAQGKEAEVSGAYRNDAVAPEYRGITGLARSVKESLIAGYPPSNWRELFAMADKAFGGTQAEGAYGVKDAYEALELGLNQYLMSGDFDLLMKTQHRLDVVRRQAKKIEDVLNSLPTQTRRDSDTVAFQQFSTPPHYAYVAAWVADAKTGERVLEPSAGNGGLAIFPDMAGAKVHANEISDKRRANLETLGFDRITGENAEQIGNIWAGKIGYRPDVVIMNPPFSASGTRGGANTAATGARHVEQALRLLKPGGRLVAVVGHTYSPTNSRTKPFFDKVLANHQLRADIEVDGNAVYRKYGTTFDTRILVIDKVAPDESVKTMTGHARDMETLIAMLAPVQKTRPEVQDDADAAARSADADDRATEAADRDTDGATSRPDRQTGGREPVGDAEPADLVSRPDRDGRGADDSGESDRVRGGSGTAQGQGSDPATRPTSGNEPVGDRGGDRGAPRADRDGNAAGAAAPGLTREESVRRGPEEEDAGGFARYRPTKGRIKGAQPHPMKLVESSAMGTVDLPNTDYVPKLPAKMIESGAISDAQLENVVMAGDSHEILLAETNEDGRQYRQGYYIGDGTGVGKTAQIAAIIADNWARGRKKHIIVSKDDKLLAGARREFKRLGIDAIPIHDFGKVKPGKDIDHETGVLFVTYTRLAQSQKKKDVKPRFQQVLDWAGSSFDGVITFDEAHLAGNALRQKAKRGWKEPSATAMAVVDLQSELPDARVVYASATGATEVSNLAYASRLGLWGQGTPFPTAANFVTEVEAGGIAAMEVVARDIKQMGVYQARSLSFEGVEYDKVEQQLTPDQREMYDVAARAWQSVFKNVEEAISKETQGGGAQRAAASAAFWSSHQRFFNQLLTSFQMPAVLEGMEKDIKAGLAPVVQIVNTNEAATKRAMAAAQTAEDLENLDITPRDILIQYVKNSFPTTQFETYVDEIGNTRNRPATDAKGNMIDNADAVERRDNLIGDIAAMTLPGNPLDLIIDRFGPQKVAEVTGRSERLITKDGKRVRERLTPKRRMADIDAFMDGKKDVLVFSQAGGTGVDFHADLGRKNQRRRAHYVLQAGWRADAAIQGFGRTHRTNQKQPPIYKLAGTDLAGHKRFTSSIARRLEQLGALTKGQKDASSSTMFSAADNLENQYAADAVTAFIMDAVNGLIKGIDQSVIEGEMGLKIRSSEGMISVSKMPDVPQFLNRLLNLEIDKQNAAFDAFIERMEARIEIAKNNGEFNAGVEDIKHEGAKIVHDQIARKDGAVETRYTVVEVIQPTHPWTWRAVSGDTNATFKINHETGKIAQFTQSASVTLSDGGTTTTYKMRTPEGETRRIDGKEYRFKFGRPMQREDAEKIWKTELKGVPKTRTNKVHMVTGALLPVWDRLAGSKPKIQRIKLDDGNSVLGRVLPSSSLSDTLQNLGVSGMKHDLTPAQMIDRVLDGSTITLSSGHKLIPRRVSGEMRVEVVPTASTMFADMRANGGLMKKMGMIVEVIQHKPRAFVPLGKTGHEPLRKLMAGKDIIAIEGDFAEQVTGFAETRVRLKRPGHAGGVHIPDRSVWDAFLGNHGSVMARIRYGRGATIDNIDRARVKIQDRFLPVLRAQTQIENAIGKPLDEAGNLYRAEELYSGQVGHDLQIIDDDYLKPMLEIIAGSDAMTADSVGQWLYARHAKERNTRIAQINPKMPKAGSGMSDDRANEILNQVAQSNDAARYREIGRIIDGLREQSLRKRVSSGLMTKKEYQQWKATYRHYVPLKGWAETDQYDAMLDQAGVGSGYQTRGPESRMAMGRQSEAFNPFVAAVAQAQEVAVRAGKNRVGNALYQIAKEHPSPSLWTVKKVTMRRRFNKVTGLVEDVSGGPVSLSPFLKPNEIAMKVDGKERRVLLHDPRLIRAVTGMGVDSFNAWVRIMAPMTRFMSMTNTMLDPDFVMRNAFRDVESAAINLQGLVDDPTSFAKAAIKNWRLAFEGAFGGLGGKKDTEWQKHFHEFSAAGGKVAFWKLDEPEEVLRNLQRRIGLQAGSKLMRASKYFRVTPESNPILDWIERANLAVDNAIRLAVFVEARKRGISKSDAASLAKNVTVNFNRRGEWTASANATYMFFNASIQSSQIILRALAHRRTRRAATLFAFMGLVSHFFNAAMSGEDDDGELRYDKIPEWKKQMNLVFMAGPNSEDAITIPLPYGWNVFPYFGDQVAKIIRGKTDPTTALGNLAASAASSFVPFSGANIAMALTPTPIRPAAEVTWNEDWLGRPIISPYTLLQEGPMIHKYGGGATEGGVAASQFLAQMTGSDGIDAGWIDVSPEHIDHVFGAYSGGLGRFIGRTSDTLFKVAVGESDEVEVRNIPFARTIYHTGGSWQDRDRFYRRRDELEYARNLAKRYLAEERPVPAKLARFVRLMDDHRKLANRRNRKLRKLRVMARDPALSAAERRRRRERLRKAEAQMMTDFNRAFLQASRFR